MITEAEYKNIIKYLNVKIMDSKKIHEGCVVYAIFHKYYKNPDFLRLDITNDRFIPREGETIVKNYLEYEILDVFFYHAKICKFSWFRFKEIDFYFPVILCKREDS